MKSVGRGLGFIFGFSFVFLGACQNISFESNLDPQNFVEYAKPGSVTLYTPENILDHRYHSLGQVTGFVCQEKEKDYIALESDARTDARIKAANLGANGLVLSKCIRLEKTQACYASVTCYGEAVKVDDSFKVEK